jgi:hypothetical protein
LNKKVYARILQIKEDPLTSEKFYYVHFINLEKRMDRWISEKIIIKSLGKANKELEAVKKYFIFFRVL